jgi:iron complex outermembrane receptor protein
VAAWLILKMETAGYFEKNNTERFTGQADIQHKINERSNLEIKSSYSKFNRLINIPAYAFEGVQQSSYSELNFSTKSDKTFWIIGANFLTDDLMSSNIIQ